jgi:hypothetical protein
MSDIPPLVLRLRIVRASERVSSLPRLIFGGQDIVDGSFDSTPELKDAAAIAGLPILTTKKAGDGHLKVGLYGARRDVVEDWLSVMRS